MKQLAIRPLITLLSLAGLATVVSGCMVPATRYEEARSAIRVEQQAHRQTQDHLGEVSARLAQVEANLDAREKRVEKLEQDLSEARLEAEQAQSERGFASELVEQLREELGRTGGHLREFADEKQQLSAALDAAESKAKRLGICEAEAADNAALVRDVALLLHEPISTGEIELAVLEGRAVLRISAGEIAGEVPEASGTKLLAAVARVTQLHPEARVRLGLEGESPESAEGESSPASRLRHISDQLAAQGLAAERVELEPVSGEPKAGEPTVVVSVFVSKSAG
jgi:hypothetical protein